MKYSITIFISTLFIINSNAQSKPNIIFILADDMGYSDMSWQGSPIKTPNLDKLVNGGMFLERNYVQPQCSPSRVSLLTGNYPYRYGLHEHIVLSTSYTGIPGKEKTIAEKMKEAGYKTSVIGKWHTGGHKQSYLPQNQGFDHSFVCIGGAISYWNYSSSGANDLIRNGAKVFAQSKLDSEESGNMYSTYMWANEAVEVIENQDKSSPFFMYLAFNSPHYPLNAPKKVVDKYSEADIEKYWSGPNAEMGRKSKSRLYYMAMVDAMDKAIGQVVAALKRKGMSENTLIVFCSDNGGISEGDNRPLRSGKGDSFEGGIRVPGIAYWPGHIKAGSRSRELVHMSDWYPTFAELAGLNTIKEGLDGMSVVRILKGEKGIREAVPIISSGRHALISSKFALVGSTENYQRSLNNNLSEFQLYNLEEDISQEHSTNEYPAIEEKMKQELMTHFSKVNRGYFNWDIKYANYRANQKKVDHNFDMVVNDQPDMEIKHANNTTTVSISPVNMNLAYKLQGTRDGKEWIELDEYICRKDTEKYIFPVLTDDKNIKKYRIETADHFGLPIHDSFSINNVYKLGPLNSESKVTQLKNVLPPINGFLPMVEIAGCTEVQIVPESLVYENSPMNGGALELKSKSPDNPVFFTRYFIEPQSQGKVYASMLVQFDANEPESIGEINWLVQNGWNGPTEKQVSLSFQNDGIYLKQADPLRMQDSIKWLATYNNKIVFVVFEFDLGTTGNDSLKIYINPKNTNKMTPITTLKGEFTFDRLQFNLIGRPGGKLKIDEIHVGNKLKQVLYKL